MGRPLGKKNKTKASIVTPAGEIERGVLPDTLGKNGEKENGEKEMEAIKIRAEKVRELTEKLKSANDRNQALSDELSSLQLKFDDLERRYRKVIKMGS